MNYKSIIVTLISHAILLFIIVIFMFCMFMLVGSIAAYVYDMQHAIPDPVERGEDLGGAFVVMFYGAISFLASFVLSVIFYKKLLTKILSFIRSRL